MRKSLKILKALNNIDNRFLNNDSYSEILSKTSFKEKCINCINNFKFRKLNPAFIVAIVCISILLAGSVYAATIIYNNYIRNITNNNITINPAYQSTLDENTINNIWIGTLDIAWKDLKEKIGIKNIEIVGGNPKIVDELNASTFSKDMLDSNDYDINIEEIVINTYKIDATLNKNLNFLQSFDNFSNFYTNMKFGNNEEFIKYFGINNASPEEMNKNVEILFYNQKNDMAIKLKTKEGDEIILYRTDDKKSFDEYYKDIELKSNKYVGSTVLSKDDELRIPYISINGMISYNELYNKIIKNSAFYLLDVIQNVNFSLNEQGCNLSSKASVIIETDGLSLNAKHLYFNDTFILFMKEKNINKPYFALKVDNSDILEKIEETDSNSISQT